MSYDLYCYKSQLGRPDLKEAQGALEVDEDNEAEEDPKTKLKIAKALINYDPQLEVFDFDFEEIAKFQKVSVDEAKEQFNHIELNSPEGNLATQITIFNNSVSITIPYWYSGNKAEGVFKKVIEYTRIIRQTTGYYVYDPQTENVYDPLTDEFDGLVIYRSMTGEVERMKNEQTSKDDKKPWWKFW